MKHPSKLLLATLLLLFCGEQNYGQNENDVLRYSWLTFGGTARHTAMGGSFGALGGDASSMSVNPAGIGIYRKSEITFSLGFDQIATDATYNGTTTSESEPSLNIPNVALIGVTDSKDGSIWNKFQFGIGHNRLQTYHSDYQIRGRNEENSLLDIFADQAAGTSPDEIGAAFPYGASLAWNAYLIDTVDASGNQYFHYMFSPGKDQVKDIHTDGRAAETYLTAGGNLDDRVYIGGTLGFASVRYTEESYYFEGNPPTPHKHCAISSTAKR